MTEYEDKTSILILASPAQAHISSYLELAKKLSHRNFSIYFCSTPINLKPISDTHDQNIFSAIRFVDLPDMAEPGFSTILDTLRPNLIIYDSFLPWAHEAAREQGIEAVPFLTLGAATTSSLVNSQEFGNYKETILESINMCSKMALINTSYEIEAEYIEQLAELVGKEVVPVGPLFPEPDNNKCDGLGITGWLSEKPPSSVLYVSFGNNHFPAKQEIEEIATGLEQSGVSFIWAVRFRKGEEMTIHEAFPEGFLRRIGERGMVVEGLVSDGKILTSPAIGGFATVCDWSSAVEGLVSGVPIIAMAMEVEQEINARLMVEIGAGMAVGREVEPGEIYKADEIARVVKLMFGEEGEILRLQVKELSKKMREKGDEQMGLVVEKLLQYAK